MEYEEINLEQFNNDELLRMKIELESEMDDIKSQLSRAEAKVHSEGLYADPVWYARAKSALRVKGRQCQQIQLMLRKNKKKKKTERPMAEHFIDICRDTLEENDFKDILEEAKQRCTDG